MRPQENFEANCSITTEDKIMSLILCGVGSRETDIVSLQTMSKIAKAFSAKGFTLRSGGAKGADSAFENSWNGPKEIFLPWNGYENKWINTGYIVPKIDERHISLAASAHPAWERCSDGAKKMHSRNTCQVLGENLDTPATILVCWTVNAEYRGGTAVAMRIADMYNIPIYNLASKNDIEKLRFYYNSL